MATGTAETRDFVMGYFPNGTAGEMYEAQYCNRCEHQNGPDGNSGCAVWLLHLLHNYDECNNDKSMLHTLIPQAKDGLDNEKCTMFLDKGLYRNFKEAGKPPVSHSSKSDG